MKKLLSILSLGVLIFSNIIPSFTYANADIEELTSLLNSFLEGASNEYQETIPQIKSTPKLKTYGIDLDNVEYITTLSGDNDEMNNFKYKIIKLGIYEIMDRNLGAETTGKRSDATVSSYGYYYQYGNNYGFSKTPTNITSEKIIVDEKYIPSKYSNPIWNNAESWTDQKGLRGIYPGSTEEERKGPCPNGWHIGTSEEYSDIYNKWKEMFPDKDWKIDMLDDLYIPNAGYKDNNFNTLDNDGGYIRNTSSTVNRPVFAANFNKMYFEPQFKGPYPFVDKSNGVPIRCIKNYPKYRVNFITNGGTVKINGIETGHIYVSYNSKLPDNLTVEHNGADLVGRYYDEELTNYVGRYLSDIKIYNETNLYAKWRCKKQYHGKLCDEETIITLVPNGGSGEIKIINLLDKEEKFERLGYTQIGWNTEADGQGTGYYNIPSELNDNITLYAQREKNPRYFYNTNGGNYNDGKKEYIEKSDYTKLDNIIFYSHTDNLDDEGIEHGNYSNKIYNKTGNIIIPGALKLQLTVKYYGNKSSNGDDFLLIWTGNYDNYTELNSGSAILNFSGWDDYNFNIYTTSGDSITYLFKSYENSRGPGYGYYIKTEGYGYTIENISKIPFRPGYTFSGRYETGANEPFDFTGTEVTKDRTFYAKWNPHHYKISLDLNGGTGLTNDIDATYGEERILPIVSKEGYTFKGRKSENGTIYNNIIPGGTGATTEDGVTVTLTAQWESIPVITPSAGGGQSITPRKQETKVKEQEHNSADTEDKKVTNTQTNTSTSNTAVTEEIKQQVKKVEDRSLTRGEVAIMTNILLEVYPQLVDGKQELDDVTNACSNYADEKNFTKDEKKAITRLCKLSIMGIHNDTNEPIEEFLVNNKTTNDEFSKVINRSIENYNEKDLSTIKDALKKLEGDEENVVFGTVYDVFMSIKSFFN